MKAYIKDIQPTGVDQVPGQPIIFGEVSSSPTVVIAFFGWKNKSPYHFGDDNLFDITTTIISDDCISCSVSSNKGVITPNSQIVLKNGTWNYLTLINPGDFYTVNILPSPIDAQAVITKIQNGQPINTINDGFKGLFKVGAARESSQISREVGIKSVFTVIQGYGLAELTTKILFLTELLNTGIENDHKGSYETLQKLFDGLFDTKTENNIQDVVKVLYQFLMTNGISSSDYTVNNLAKTFNEKLKIPQTIATLLGQNDTNSLADISAIYRLLLGVQQYSPTFINGSDEISENFFPSNMSEVDSGIFESNQPCQGTVLQTATNWSEVQIESIMRSYVNSPINELYGCFKLDQDGFILPTLVMRQIPLTSTEFQNKYNFSDFPVTQFLSLPRWRIHPSLIYTANLGRDDALRCNFVQVWGQTQINNQDLAGTAPAQQIAGQIPNYARDQDDISRHGLYPVVFRVQFDNGVAFGKQTFSAGKWAQLMADILIGGHLKLTGSIECTGIYDPITVGDNLQIDNSNETSTVFHIESLTHSYSVSPEGDKTFQTSFDLTNGILDVVANAPQRASFPKITYALQSDNQTNVDTNLQPVTSNGDSISAPPVPSSFTGSSDNYSGSNTLNSNYLNEQYLEPTAETRASPANSSPNPSINGGNIA